MSQVNMREVHALDFENDLAHTLEQDEEIRNNREYYDCEDGHHEQISWEDEWNYDPWYYDGDYADDYLTDRYDDDLHFHAMDDAYDLTPTTEYVNMSLADILRESLKKPIA